MVLLFMILSFWLPSEARITCSSLFYKRNESVKTLNTGNLERTLKIFKPYNFSSKKKYPVLIYFHGTGFKVNMNHPLNAKHGLYFETEFIRTMTDAGFVVVAPTANSLWPFVFPGGVLAWEANVSPYSSNFASSRDFLLVKGIFEHLDVIIDARADGKNIFLAGFSSGGYMSSRIAIDSVFADKIAGLIIHSASYGTCLQGNCFIPEALPEWHPTTLLIGNKDDSVVPYSTVEYYRDQLEKNNVPVELRSSEQGDHAWLAQHPQQILKWAQEKLK